MSFPSRPIRRPPQPSERRPVRTDVRVPQETIAPIVTITFSYLVERAGSHPIERFGQNGESRQRVRVRRGDQVDRDLVCARVQVPEETGRNGGGVAVHDQGVDQPVATAAGQVGVVEAERAQVVGVVHQAQVRLLDRRAADRPGPDGIGVQHHLLLRDQDRADAEDLPGPPGVLGCDQVRVGTGGAFGGEPQHLGSQGGQHPPRWRDLLGVEHIEVGHEFAVRFGVPVTDRLRMADAQTQQEPVGMPGHHAVVRGGHRLRIVTPDVHDPGRHGQRGRGIQQFLDQAEITVRGAEPQRGIPELFQRHRQPRRYQRAPPKHPEPAQTVHHARSSVPLIRRLDFCGQPGRRRRLFPAPAAERTG